MPVVTIITCRGVLGGVMCVLLGSLDTAPVVGEKKNQMQSINTEHTLWSIIVYFLCPCMCVHDNNVCVYVCILG